MSSPFHFLFPADYFHKQQVDDIFSAEADALQQAGFSVSTVDLDEMKLFRLPELNSETRVVYRGWMLKKENYSDLIEKIQASKNQVLIDLDTYLSTHHLPNWYPLIQDLTPETIVLPETIDLEQKLQELNWNAYFIKDYVKSLKTAQGAIIHQPHEIHDLISAMKQFRGEIEGGLCVRHVEDFNTETEQRYFVLNGKVFAANQEQIIPEIVQDCAKRIQSPFFSVDLVIRKDGIARIIEIGDGQVSDLVGWSPSRFATIWSETDVN